MPHSKSRHPQKHHPQNIKTSNTHPKAKKSNSAIYVSILFCALLGFGISYFINASDSTVLITGTILGALSGLIFGYMVNKSLSEK
jgi:hypothetical protein